MTTALAIPEHKLLESPNSRTIEIGDWVITASTNPISNAPECDTLQSSLSGLPLPEMTFGNNVLTLKHKCTGWKYAFSTEQALHGVKNGELEEGDGGVKVGYADAWLRSRCVIINRETVLKDQMLPGRVLNRSRRCPRLLRPNHTIGLIPLHILGMK